MVKFLITNNMSSSISHLEFLFLGSLKDTLLVDGPHCHFDKYRITSVVPGDFDGDALMDILVTMSEDSDSWFGDKSSKHKLKVFINWGGSDHINCSDVHEKPVLETIGEPIALDYNRDMIIDLFGLDAEGLSSTGTQSR